SFPNLVGGSGNDTFEISNLGDQTLNIDGGGQTTADILALIYGSAGNPVTLQITGGQIVSSDGANFNSLTYPNIENVPPEVADPGAGFRNAVYIDDLTSDFNLNTTGNTDINIGNANQNAAAILAAHSITLNNNGTAADNVTLYDQSSTDNSTWTVSSSSVDAG